MHIQLQTAKVLTALCIAVAGCAKARPQPLSCGDAATKKQLMGRLVSGIVELNNGANGIAAKLDTANGKLVIGDTESSVEFATDHVIVSGKVWNDTMTLRNVHSTGLVCVSGLWLCGAEFYSHNEDTSIPLRYTSAIGASGELIVSGETKGGNPIVF